MRALVIGNRDDADVGVLGEWAEAKGLVLESVDREDGRLPPLDDVDVVMSLGSVWRVNDPDLAPLLQDEQLVLRTAVSADLPVLAICFGMQQLTVAFGGEVFATEQPEIGFRVLPPADPCIPTGPWMQYHYDACRLPPGATELARNDHGLQAYRLGSALAVQFHPEVDRPVLERWTDESGDELAAMGLPRSLLLDEADQHVDDSRDAAFALFDAFWASRPTVQTGAQTGARDPR
jgi:GMP synthase-like glutamine amidotransferase